MSEENYITVKSGLGKAPPAFGPLTREGVRLAFDDGGEKVAMWERDERHSDGEAFVTGDKPVRVFPTERVMQLLSEGRLIRADSEQGTTL